MFRTASPLTKVEINSELYVIAQYYSVLLRMDWQSEIYQVFQQPIFFRIALYLKRVPWEKHQQGG